MPRGKGSKNFLPPGKIGLQGAALASNKKISSGLKSKTQEPTLGITSVSQQQVEGSQVVAEEVVCDVNSASTQVGSHVVPAISKLPSIENQPSRPNPDLHHTNPPITNDNLEDSIETDEDKDAPPIHADRQPQKSVDGRTYLEPNGTTFFPYVAVCELAKIIIKTFGGPGPWYKWSEVSIEVRKMWFKEFQKEYTWEMHYDCAIRKNFEIIRKARLKSSLFKTRETFKKKKIPPNWITKEHWESLQSYWSTPAYKNIFTTNSKNRMSSNDGFGPSKHTSSSMSTTEYSRRHKEPLGSN